MQTLPTRILAVALAAAAALLLPAAASFAQTLATVRVATTADDNSTPILYGVQSGRFRAAGLDVQIQQVSNGSAIAAGIAGGAYDVGKASITSILTSHLRGIPFKIVAGAGLYDAKAPYGVLLVASDSPIHTAKDLNGQTLGIGALLSIDEVGIDSWMDHNGADSKSLKYVEIPQSALQAALEAHRIAAAVLNRPQLDNALAAGKVRTLYPIYDAIAPSFLSSGWFATSDWANAHADTLARFVRVVQEASRYANSHHSETAPILAQFSGIQLDIIEKSPRAVLGTTLTPALVQPVIDQAAKYGMLPRAFPAQEVIYVPPAGSR
jgi:NitT/TauT family transport system substrate-binding protein